MIGNTRNEGEQHRLLRKATAATVLVAILLAVGGGTAAGQTDINGCTTPPIQSSGSYEIPSKIDAPPGSGFCVDIAASDVVIDGNGNTIEGIGESGSVGLNVEPFGFGGAFNVTVKNVTVSNFDTGVRVEGAENIELIDVDVNSTNTSVLVEDSTNVTVEDATISDTDVGVNVTASSGVTVKGSSISSTEFIPIIDPILPPPDFPTLDTSSVGTQSTGGSGPGILLNETQGAVIENNTVRDFEEQGIFVSAGNTPLAGLNEIVDNEVINNSQGILVSVTGNTGPNQVVDNELTANDLGIGVLDFPPSSSRNVVSGNELTDNGNGIALVAEEEDVIGNRVVNSTEFGITTASTKVNLRENFVNDSGGSGIRVEIGSFNNLTDNVVKDNGEAGIQLGSGGTDVDNNTLVNNTATGNRYGVWLSDADDNELRENTANRNNKTGIYLNRTSTGNEIRDNKANDNGEGFVGQPGTYGIWLENGSNRNEIVDNEAFDNGIGGGSLAPSAGIYLGGGGAPIGPTDPVNNNTVVDNRVGSSQSGNQTYGIWLSGANKNELRDNVAENNDKSGIYLGGTVGFGTTNNTLVNNTARGSKYGIWLKNAFDNDVSESLVENNHEGIAVEQTLTPLSEGVETEYVRQTGNTFTDDVSKNNDWDFVVDSLNLGPVSLSTGTSGFPVTNLSIGASTAPDTTLSFNADDVRLVAVDNPEPNPDAENISRYFNASETGPGGDGFLNVSLRYDDSDVSGVNESTLKLQRFDTSASGWQTVPGSEVDENENVVGANITMFSDFGVFGEPAAGGTRNPFFDASGNPVGRRTVINRVIEWNMNGTIDGTPFTRREIINFVVQWNMAT